MRELCAAGGTVSAIARAVGISRATVREWIARPPQYLAGAAGGCEAVAVRQGASWNAERYAYLLGLYLGDGCISAAKRDVYVLRISLDNKYPNIIAECADAVSAVLPRRTVGHTPAPGCTVVTAYWKHWPCLFPQHGPGLKHHREISLERWQIAAVQEHPGSFLRGLIHSDGCRFTNHVRRGDRTYGYPKYEFVNLSQGIHALFQWACDLVGVESRHPNLRSTSVARRPSVEILDSFIGPKS